MNRMTPRRFRPLATTAMTTATLLIVAGCQSAQSPERAAVEIKGSDPAATASAAPAPAAPPVDATPSASGIMNYDGYQAAVARSGDTVTSVAQRIGLSASELGAYNGLTPDYALRAGDELVLPPRPGGYSTGAATAPAAPQPTFEIVRGAPAPASEPVVAPLESAPLASGGDPAAAPAPGSADGSAWSLDLAAAAIDRASGFDAEGNLAAPPSSEDPLPPAPQAPVELASPELRQYQTPGLDPLAPTPPQRPVETIITPQEEAVDEPAQVAAVATPPEAPVELRLIRPVTGPIVIGFNQGAGRAQNDGIDFASPANSPVVAAASGEVALVSQSLGGLGTIVLVRHKGDWLTVYGRIEKVTVRKGDIVSQGQKIGVVSPATQPRMHFEVRKGAESQNPEKFF